MDTKEENLLWPNWVDYLKQERQSDFIAQGTLINKQSIGQTIGRAILRGPAIAFGVRRIFNFALEDENYEEHGGRYSRSTKLSHRATLNILETENVEDKVNGVLFSADTADIPNSRADCLPNLFRIFLTKGTRSAVSGYTRSYASPI